MLRIHLCGAVEDNNSEEEVTTATEEDEQEDKPKRKAAQSQANPYAKKQKQKDTPQFLNTFESSNIDAVAYDPEKKQLWVRFKGKDVYTYFDVPLKIYRGFWSAPSKGHYFWEKIRKNAKIKYQKLTAALRWYTVSSKMQLNAAKQSNIAAVAKALKNRLKRFYDADKLLVDNAYNNKRVITPDVVVDIGRYGAYTRIDLHNPDGEYTEFYRTSDTDTSDIADWALAKFIKYRDRITGTVQLQAATQEQTTNSTVHAALLQLTGYLNDAIPEESWELDATKDVITSDNYTIDVSPGSFTDEASQVQVTDSWSDKTYAKVVMNDNLVSYLLTWVMAIVLQGE